jgi:hypothetical protein
MGPTVQAVRVEALLRSESNSRMRRERIMRSIVLFLVLALLTSTAFANDSWEDRLRTEMDKAEATAAELDGEKAVRSAPLEDRVEALHARVAVLEKARGMEAPPLAVRSEEASSRLQVLTKAVIGLSARLRKVKRHDSPPAVTPSKPEPPPTTPAPEKAEEPPELVEWPETLTVNATASVDYTSVGEWAYRMLYPTLYDRPEYRLVGYEGRVHFSLRLVGLKEEVRSVDVVLVVTRGTGPFKFSEPPRYELRWRARHRHMWNGALKQLVNYDTWSQDVPPRWGGFWGKSVLRPSVFAYVTKLTTKDGRVVTFEEPQ